MQVGDLPSVGNLLIAAGVGAVAIMQRSILSNQKEHSEKLERIDDAVTKIKHWAWGPLEDNGINSKVNRLENDMASIKNR